MKRQFVIIALLVNVLLAFALGREDLPRFDVGLRASLLSSYNSITDDERCFVMPGIAFDVKIGNIPLYIESGAYYTQLNYAHQNKIGGKWPNNKYEVYFLDDNALMVPVLASWHIGFDNHVVLQPFCGFLYAYGFDSEKSYGGIRLGAGVSWKRFYANVGIDVLEVLRSEDRINKHYIDDNRYEYEDDYHFPWDYDNDYGTVGNFFITLGFNFNSY